METEPNKFKVEKTLRAIAAAAQEKRAEHAERERPGRAKLAERAELAEPAGLAERAGRAASKDQAEDEEEDGD